MELFCVDFYIFAGFSPFRRVQMGGWGWYLAGKLLPPLDFRSRSETLRSYLGRVSLLSPISSHMFTHELLPPSPSHSQPVNRVMLCVSQIPHSQSCQLCIPALPAAASHPSCGCQSGILPWQAEKSPFGSNPVQPSSLQTHQCLNVYEVFLSASIVWLLRKHLQNILMCFKNKHWPTHRLFGDF